MRTFFAMVSLSLVAGPLVVIGVLRFPDGPRVRWRIAATMFPLLTAATINVFFVGRILEGGSALWVIPQLAVVAAALLVRMLVLRAAPG